MSRKPGKQTTPMVLLEYQQRWLGDESPVKVAEKSRRVGFSWAEAADAALLAAQTHGMDVWYVGYNKDMAREFIRDCADWARAYALAAAEFEETKEIFQDGDEEKAVLAYVIRFASGHRITALSSRPANLRGKQGRVIIDEAAFHPDLKGLIKAAMALLMWGGQVHIFSSHNGDSSEFNELVNEIRAGKNDYSLHRVTFEDAVRQGLFERICLRLKKPWTAKLEAKWVAEIRAFYGSDADEELDCIPSKGGGTYLSLALLESRIRKGIPILKYTCKPGHESIPEPMRLSMAKAWCDLYLQPLLEELPREARCFYGMDFARKCDLSVIWPLVQVHSLTRKTPFVIELRNVPHEEQKLILFYVVDSFPLFLGGCNDAGGNGSWLAEAAAVKYGALIQQVMLSEAWYRDNMPPFKAAIEDGTLDELPDDVDTIDDFRSLELVKGVARIPDKRKTDKDGNKRHGDAVIACALAHVASRHPAGPIEFRAGPSKLSRWSEDCNDNDDFSSSRWKSGGAW
ncbi:MAG TPA: terminase family protein [Pseudomonas sp.]|uniref:terminase large subunit domain-containing protein n=1 Tax=Pseudomonas sp. TaxID=306 RepID=UPI002D08FD7F|nr:terminase family protein [Pseudomonas sp.]HWH86343.1 terminase family protein [Pseudomonas sp.]